MDRNFMNSLYSDLFGDNPGDTPRDGAADGAKDGGKLGSESGVTAGSGGSKADAAGGGGSESDAAVDGGSRAGDSFDELQGAIAEKLASQEDALRHAQDALDEARKLFGDVDALAGQTGSALNDAIARTTSTISSLPGIQLPEGYLPGSPAGGSGRQGATGGLTGGNGAADDASVGSDGPGTASDAGSGSAGQAAEAAAPAEPEEDPMEQLDRLIGLTTIKHDVRELTDFVSVQKMRKDAGLKSVPVSLHLVFTGNPGTGKTTVARILAKLYKNIGVLSKGQLVEVDRSGLVAGYVGQTAIKTQEKIAEAMGGVLFIDEAYSLAQKDDAFGQEAIDTILKAMEDHRDDFVVVVAGYTKPMEKFINSNPGLKSRFNKYIEFPDYTVDELEQIFAMNCRKYDYEVEEDAKKHIREMIVSKKLAETENFANAREVRNMFEQIITNQARRVKQLPAPTHEDMITITMEDLDLSDGEATAESPDGAAPGAKAGSEAAPQQKASNETE